MKKILTNKLTAIVLAVLLLCGYFVSTPGVELTAKAFAYNHTYSQIASTNLPDPNNPNSPNVVGLNDHQSLTLGRQVPAHTNAFNLPNNSNYNISGQNPIAPTAHPFGNNFATISLHTLNEGGDMQRETNVLGINTNQGFGFVAGSNPSLNGNTVEVKLHYNFNALDYARNGWRVISHDHNGGVNGHNNVRQVRHGALILETSDNGNQWGTTNPFPDEDGNHDENANLFTVDFAAQFRPNVFDNSPYQVHRLAPVRDAQTGNVVPNQQQYAIAEARNQLTLYVPDGQRMVNGMYVRITFAYAIQQGNNANTQRQIVEQTTFFIANNSGEIAFRNLYFETWNPPSEEDKEDEDEISEEDRLAMSELLQLAGSIKNGHASNDGFVLNFLGNTSYNVTVSRNGANRVSVRDGQMFYQPGRYNFEIQTHFRTRRHTIFINERGIQRNLEIYFGQSSSSLNTNDPIFGLITQDSRRILSTTDNVPVYHVGRTFWHTQAVSEFRMPLMGEIVNTSLPLNHQDRTIRVGGFDSNGNIIRSASNGQLTHPGIYVATFANNLDFFTGTHSGDTFRFVFEFLVIELDESDLGPSLN